MKKKDIIELSITGVLIFILLFAVINGIKSRTAVLKKKTLQGEVLREKISGHELKGEDKELFRRLEKETKNLKLTRDPFTRSLITPIETSSSLHLDGIVWDKEESIAIINNIFVRIGDTIGSNVVFDIKPDRVILSDGTKYFTLK